MNLFQHWAGSDMFRITWAISVYTYGARFQGFCTNRLGLTLGKISVNEKQLIKISVNENQLLENLKESKYLNFVERNLIETIFHDNRNKVNDKIEVVYLIIEVPTIGTAYKSKDEKPILRFPIGFALKIKDQLRYFRIQNHLRKTGLGARALDELFKTDSSITGVSLLSMSTANQVECPDEQDRNRFLALCRAHGKKIFLDGHAL